MAVDYDPVKFSAVAGATFSTSDLYKGVTIDSSGHAVLYHNGAGTTGGKGVAGTLYSVTSTTDSAGSEAVTIAQSGVLKGFMSGSTLAAGDLVTFSTDDSHLVAATTNEPFGQILAGSSGSTGRIVSVIRQ